jgi:uncharacterized protein (TIGR01777 family)
MTKIVIAGGSGLVGKKLTQMLTENGHEVAWLTRNGKAKSTIKLFEWDIKNQTIDKAVLDFAEVIINLAGAGVADKKWSDAYKKEIYDSRILSTQLLANALTSNANKVNTYISASAIGIYGNNTAPNTTENTPAADTFLAKVCEDWESTVKPIENLGIRTGIIRVGVVLAKDGGFIKEVSIPINMFAGAALGNGQQQTSWIHIDDLCRIFIGLVENKSLSGVFNGVAPNPESNKKLTQLLAKQLGKPLILPNAPAFVIKLLFGEMGSMLLGSQHISAQKILDSGFTFQFPTAQQAIADLVQ